jgi:hypothetical protein
VTKLWPPDEIRRFDGTISILEDFLWAKEKYRKIEI